ncbi:hypothetical protein KDL29_14895 [bacterium]|nr:hypothetical protein [bacterium]
MEEEGRSQVIAQIEESRGHLHRIHRLLADLKGRNSPAESIEEDLFRVREGYHNFRLDSFSQPAPEINFQKNPVSHSLNLRFFSRTLQRTQLVGHFLVKGQEVPVHYSITGAIVLMRQNRSFKVWGSPALRYNVLLPFRYVEDKGVLDSIRNDSLIHLVDSEADRNEYTQMRISAVRKAHEITRQLRGGLFSQWKEKEGKDLSQVMVADGMIEDLPNSDLTDNFIATSRTVYVPWQNSELVESQLTIPAYRRGEVMKVTDTTESGPNNKYTWFTRMRMKSQSGPEFGLLRTTIIADSEQDALERANAFSSCLVAERLPVTYPADNWDKLIFPHKLCNDFLESMIPTQTTVKSYFARM